MSADQEKPSPPPEKKPDRRGSDRRQEEAPRDERGHIRTSGYMGPDRRSGIDRRAHLRQQQLRARAEKLRFVQRMALTFSFFFIAIVLVGVFLLAPEYAALRKKAEERPLPMEKQAEAVPAVPLGMKMNEQIRRAESVAGALTETAQDVLAVASGAGALATETARQIAAGDDSGLRELVGFVGRIYRVAQSGGGVEELRRAAGVLKQSLKGWQGDVAGFETAVTAARQSDPALGALFEGVTPQDAGAAAMLLLLGEFRGNIDEGRPFAEDLAVLERLAAGNPELQQSLRGLAPYAADGVLTRAALQAEFKSLAMDIVRAKAMGETVDIRGRVQARLDEMVRVRRVDVTEGDSTDAVVNRAQILLDKGDIAGAIRELQSLEGASAQAAAPFVTAASGSLMAQQSSQDLASLIIGQLAAGGGVSAEGLKGLLSTALGGAFSGTGAVSPVSGMSIGPGGNGAGPYTGPGR